MKIGDIVRVGGKHPALVIAVAHRGSRPVEVRVRFLKEAKTRWVLSKLAEVVSEYR